MCVGGGGTPREIIFMKSYCLDLVKRLIERYFSYIVLS